MEVDRTIRLTKEQTSSLCCLIEFDHVVLRHAVEGFSGREGSESIPSLSSHQNIRVLTKLHVDIYFRSKFTKKSHEADFIQGQLEWSVYTCLTQLYFMVEAYLVFTT